MKKSLLLLFISANLFAQSSRQITLEDNSPINLQSIFLLVHGTRNNMPFQNSVAFSEALIQANKPFEQASYPNKNHSIYGGNTSLHLYSKLTESF